MDSGHWFKTIISSKKGREYVSKQVMGSSAFAKTNGFKWKNKLRKESASCTSDNPRFLNMPVQDLAAIRIQTAFRAYMARKTLRRLKGALRLQTLTQKYSVKKQATTTLNCLHSWSKIQTQIRARRQFMVAEGRLRQKKLENQLKLEAKLHDLEVEWCGGPETMAEVLGRIHLREEAAVKRERAMAYAFSHQWRASSSQNFGVVNNELSKANWGWSWKDRWIAARPWESRVPAQFISPKTTQNKQANKTGKSTNSPIVKTPIASKPSLSNGKEVRRFSYPAAEKGAMLEGSIKTVETNSKTSTSSTGKTLISSKPSMSNGKGAMKARRLSYSAAEKGTATKGSIKTEEANSKREQLIS